MRRNHITGKAVRRTSAISSTPGSDSGARRQDTGDDCDQSDTANRGERFSAIASKEVGMSY